MTSTTTPTPHVDLLTTRTLAAVIAAMVGPLPEGVVILSRALEILGDLRVNLAAHDTISAIRIIEDAVTYIGGDRDAVIKAQLAYVRLGRPRPTLRTLA